MADEAGDAVKVFDVQSGALMAHITGPALQAPVHLILHGETLYIGASGTGSILALDLTSTPPSGKLKARVARIADAPSGFVLLLFNTHRIVYLPKTIHAPTLRELQHTSEHLFRIQREARVQEEMERLERKRGVRARMNVELPRPYVKIVPLASAASLDRRICPHTSISQEAVRTPAKRFVASLLRPAMPREAAKSFDRWAFAP